MQNQTYPTDHVIYVNSADERSHDFTTLDYSGILDDLIKRFRPSLKVGYGPSKSHHENYLAALNLVSIDQYDLFLKIDDDDIYFCEYVRGVVGDFQTRHWDYSGTMSNGYLNGFRWRPRSRLIGLGLDEQDVQLGIPEIMPPTAAFSRKAIEALLQMDDDGSIEDLQWRRHLARTQGMRMAARSDTNFVYNIHGGNLSMSDWLETDE